MVSCASKFLFNETEVQLNIGIKTGDLSILNFADDLNISFFEYQSPKSGFFNYIHKVEYRFDKIIQHSTYLELAKEEINFDVLERIKLESNYLNSEYIGEHIGFLNPNKSGPTLGYLLAPSLNENTVKNVVKNSAIVQRELNIPVALEFGVFYFKDDLSTMSLAMFIKELDSKLDKNVGWLIDIAHLYVSAKNLGESFDEILDIFNNSKRKIFEVHIAGARKADDGVFHDCHQIELNKVNTYLISKCRDFKSANLTLEIDRFPSDCTGVNFYINSIKRIIDEKKQYEDPYECASLDRKVLIHSEKKGRVQILKHRVISQLRITPEDCTYFESLLDAKFFDRFYSFCWSFDLPSAPYFSMNAKCNHDISWAFLIFLREVLEKEQICDCIDRFAKYVKESSVNLKINMNNMNEEQKFNVLFLSSGIICDKGLYKLLIENDDIFLEEYGSQEIDYSNSFIFDDRKGVLWNQKRESKLEQCLTSSPLVEELKKVDLINRDLSTYPERREIC